MISKSDVWMLFALGVLTGITFSILAVDLSSGSLDFWSLIQAGWLVYAVGTIAFFAERLSK